MYLTIFLIAALAACVSLLVYCFTTRNKKAWSCNNNSCQEDSDGEFTSKSACHQHCQNPQTQTVYQQKEIPETKSYNCNSNTCIEVDGNQGVYTSKETCQQHCNINRVYNPFYLPQSLYSPYIHHTWLHYRDRFHHRDHHRHHKDYKYKYKYESPPTTTP